MPTRIGILHTAFDARTEVALKYLVLQMNSLQNSFEFSFLPMLADPLMDCLEAAEPVDQMLIAERMPSFCASYLLFLRAQAEGFGIVANEPNCIVILTKARLKNRWYFMGGYKWAILALGEWEDVMAPPSVIEFILALLVQIGAITACGEEFPPSHCETKGCLFDFTANLRDAGFKALTGFLCSACADTIRQVQSEELVKDMRVLLGREWLGSSNDPKGAANIARKLGFPLFSTSGLAPSFREKLRSSLEQEGTKVILDMIKAILLAMILLWLGLKKPG
jgi:hypothetical protein